MGLPLSQIPFQAFDHQLASIALEKFSFAVTPVGTGSHQWVHDTRKDELFLVFRQTQQSQGENRTESQLVMNVSVGSQKLECQDLRKLIAIVEDFEGQRRQGLVDCALEPPVHVVVKYPCVALRYPTSPALRRRIQMRFKNNNDYQRVVHVFEELKFPISNFAKTGTSAAPMMPLRSASTSLIQNSSRSYNKDQISLSDVANCHETRASNTVNDISYALHRPFLTEESPFFKRSHTASSETLRPGSSLSFGGSKDSDTVSSMSFGEPLVRSCSVIDYARPMLSLSASQFERETRMSLLSTPGIQRDDISQSNVFQFQDRNTIFSRSRAMSEAFEPPLPRSQATSSNIVSSGSQYEGRRAASGHGDTIMDRFDIDKQMNRRISLVPNFLRPLSAPVPSTPENLSQWLPPRRELPFPKARIAMKSCTPSVDLSPSNDLKLRAGELRVDEIAKFVAPGDTAQMFTRGVKRVAQRRINRAPQATQENMSDSLTEGSADSDERDVRPQIQRERQKEPSPLAAKSAVVIRSSTAADLQSKVMTTAMRKRPSATELDILQVSKQARKMVDRATQTQTLSGRDHTAPLALATVVGRSSSATTEEAIQPPDSLMTEIEAFVSKHKHRPAPQELWQRPGYAEASPEERQAIINDFICENLDNEDFLKLCEDTGNVWRRIGLEI